MVVSTDIRRNEDMNYDLFEINQTAEKALQ